jgi:antitoxin component HigA of HigAB toxin-antitoxin module
VTAVRDGKVRSGKRFFVVAQNQMPYVSDAAMLSSLMGEKGVRQADIIRDTGISKTVLSLVLNGKRELTRQHIGILSKYLELDLAEFLGTA